MLPFLFARSVRFGGVATRAALLVALLAVVASNFAVASTTPASSPIRTGRFVGAAPTARTDGRIGIELADVASSQPIFVDAMKQAAPWSSAQSVRRDALGNVVELAAGQSAQTVVCAGGGYPAGDYVLLFDGHGTLSLDGATVVARAAGRSVVRLSPGVGGIRLRLTATDPRDYVRNVRLIAPGYEGSYARAPFFPGVVAALTRVHVLRFANWSRAGSFTGPLDWSNRSVPGQFSQAVATGVAPEYLVALANATGDDPWFAFPAGVTDAYVAQFAQLVRTTLDPRLHPTFEYGQAMWTPGSPAERYATLAGLNARLTTSPQAAASAWYAARAAQIFARLSLAFAHDARGVHRVLALPLGSPGTAGAALGAALLASPAGHFADVVALDAIDGSHAQAPALAATAALARRSGLAVWAAAADAPAVAGGASVGDASANEAAVRASYDAMFAGWHAAGGGLAVTSASGTSGKWAAVADVLARYPAAHVQASPSAPVAARAAVTARVPQARRALAPGSEIIAINCGASAGNGWVADTDYSTPSYTFGEAKIPVSTLGVIAPAPQPIYQTQRRAHMVPLTYTIPGLTPSTAYTVRLHFAEIATNGIGKRIFNASINGTQVLSNFDVQATAGGFATALVENFYATANSAGQIMISFTGVVGDPIINGIEIQVPGPIDVTAIDAGGPATANWKADVDFNGGSVYAESTTPINTTGVVNPAPQAVYKSERYSTSALSYAVPGFMPGVSYTVRLHFAELTLDAKGARVFNVAINGTQVLTDFDIFATAGAQFTAVVESFTTPADANGMIAVAFTPVVGEPQINGIEIQGLPVVDGAALDAGGATSGVWQANTDSSSLIATTTQAIATAGVLAPAPQAIYQTQRFMTGNPLVYAIPGLTPNAPYTLRLHFAEFTVGKPGQRVFNVLVDGVQLLTNFDIYAAAGGANRAIVEDLPATADAAGQVSVEFVNVVGNPAVNGIELLSETTPAAPPVATPTPTALCIGGTSYAPTQDDEFSQDTTVNYSPTLIVATPQPNGAVWSSRAWDFLSDGSRKNIGTDDAYYTDPTRGLGSFSPFSLQNGMLTITAVPVPAEYQNAPQLLGAHWLSGLLESAQLTYGYIELSAAVPNTVGEFSAPLWLLAPYGSDGNNDGYAELDANEMFGDTFAPGNVVFQTQNFTAAAPGSKQVVRHTFPSVEVHYDTQFHTYGVLWTPSIVRFYVDREPTGPDWPNGAFGPMHAIINLGVFTQNTWAPPPPNGNPLTMNVQYFRWYQSNATSCSPAQIPS